MTRALRRGLGLAVFTALALAACARVRPLTGGPPDITPPELLEVSPPDSSTGIPVVPEIRLVFSEKVDAASVQRGLRFYPDLEIARLRVKGAVVRVGFADSLPPDTTLAVVLGRQIQDLPGRDNKLPAEIWLLYSTGPQLQSAAVLGRVLLKDRPEPKGVVTYEPVEDEAATSAGADTTADPGAVPAADPTRRRTRYPVAAADDQGLYRLLGIAPERAFVLRAFVDRDNNQRLDEGELAAPPETLRLAAGEVRRGLVWNLIDPDEPGRVSGVALNLTALDARVGVALRPLRAESPGSATEREAEAPEGVGRGGTAAAADSSVHSATGGLTEAAATAEIATADTVADEPGRALVDIDTVGVRADTLRPLPLPVPDRDASGWGQAYAGLEPRGYVRSDWRFTYASPRGDFDIRVPPGRHQIAAFVDVSRDSVPGLYVSADSTSLEWEPFWLGGIVEVQPGGEIRARTIEIESP